MVWLKRVVLILLGIYLLLVSLAALREGASTIDPLLEAIGVDGVAGWLGFGWLAACLMLSGSPAAVLALQLLGEGQLDRFEAFAMIIGSRLGSCFVVLFVGFVHDLRSKQQGRTAYIGVASLLVTAALVLPALAIGEALLADEWLVSVLQVENGASMGALLDPVLAPLGPLFERLPHPAWAFAIGVALLLLAFKIFDLALPDVSRISARFGPLSNVLFRPGATFLLGLVVTLLTLSVSVSLTVLVPLTARGWVRRENLFPYMMGANISTYVDTLFVSLLVVHPHAVAVVLLVMACVTLVCLPLVFVLLAPFERIVDRASRASVRGHRNLFLFVLGTFLVPLLLLAL